MAQHNLFQLIERPYQKVAFAQNLWVDLFLYQFEQALDIHLKSSAYSLVNHLHYNDGIWKNDADVAFRSYEELLEANYDLPGSLYFSFLDKFQTYLESEFEFKELRKDYPRGIPNQIKYRLYFVLEQLFESVTKELMHLPEPFISYLHFWPPHEPFCAHRRFVGSFDDGWSPAPKPHHRLSGDVPEESLNQSRRECDEYISNVDAEFGRLYDRLQATGLLDNSYLIVTSDHGQLFERGVWGHVTPLLFDPVIHVPLLISAPGQSARQDIYSLTSCVDLVPTILKITGGIAPSWLEGRVLPGFGEASTNDRPIFAIEAKKNPPNRPITHGTFAMLKGDYKLIWYMGYSGYEDVYELYDLKNDPEELEDLSRSEPEVVQSMKKELQSNFAHVDQTFAAAA